MGYNSLPQVDRDNVYEASHSSSHDNKDFQNDMSPSMTNVRHSGGHSGSAASLRLFLDGNTSGFDRLVRSIVPGAGSNSDAEYGILEADDIADDGRNSSPSYMGIEHQQRLHDEQPLHIPPRRKQRRSPPATIVRNSSTNSSTAKPSSSEQPEILRTASGQSIALRHPTPDLQVLQGAYRGNIDLLEKTAERLSMTSSIDEAIRELHDEQKRSDSRRSSLLESQASGRDPISRQVSNASSIVEVNSAARSGGFSPAGFMMSPKGSLTTGNGRGRSASKSSRFGSRPEPELEGRPLDSFVSPSLPTSPVLPRSASLSEASPALPQTGSIPEQDEKSVTLTRPSVGPLETALEDQDHGHDRPSTSASLSTLEQSQVAFADFDGTHVEPPRQRTISENESNTSNNEQRRMSSLSRASMARPQSYADPNTGQQMVYYPAPVPMMLNLPQKLSKNPSSTIRNKRRTQVLSSIPPAARQSAIWLPDVLENEDEPELAEDDPSQSQEYIPQHQRMTMGGRRNTQDLAHLPPQLRANAFFELPGPTQIVELKEQSAVATLDSILDASAHAPVSAFTDHAFAGRLGAEVYGKEHVRHKSSTNLLNTPAKKRTSSFNLLRGRRASSSDLFESDQEKRRATMSGMVEGNSARKPSGSDHEEEDGSDHEATLLQETGIEPRGDYGLGSGGDVEPEDPVYHGAPTTLLAELQLRKQQQKHRTRPLTTTFPNGVHSTLLELDAVAQVEQKTRKQKRINLAWEDPSIQQLNDANGDDEDVPLALLYSKKEQDRARPMGLMERRDMEDNEPLSRRRDRLQGKPLGNRASTMMNLTTPVDFEEEGETLAQRVHRLKGQERSSTGLPAARPVSGDFATEMMSQFGGDLLETKGKGKDSITPSPEEEETLGQRRKRLQAEREARALEVGKAGESLERPALKTRRSMADILQAHPSAGADRLVSYQKPASGLLGLHEKRSQQRASTMLNLNSRDLPGQRTALGAFQTGVYNDGPGGIIPQQQYARSPMLGSPLPHFPQPSLGGFNPGGFGVFPQPMMMPFQTPYPMNMGYMSNLQGGMGMGVGMAQMNGMTIGADPLNQKQIDMVERWRQSVMQ